MLINKILGICNFLSAENVLGYTGKSVLLMNKGLPFCLLIHVLHSSTTLLTCRFTHLGNILYLWLSIAGARQSRNQDRLNSCFQVFRILGCNINYGEESNDIKNDVVMSSILDIVTEKTFSIIIIQGSELSNTESHVII